MSKALICLFFMYFNVIEKKNIILEELQIVKKKEIFICEISEIIIILIY